MRYKRLFLLLPLLLSIAFFYFLWIVNTPFERYRVVGVISESTTLPYSIDLNLGRAKGGVWELGIFVKGEPIDDKNVFIKMTVENFSKETMYVRDGNIDVAVPYGEKILTFNNTLEKFVTQRNMIFRPEVGNMHFRIELDLKGELNSSQLEIVAYKQRPSF